LQLWAAFALASAGCGQGDFMEQGDASHSVVRIALASPPFPASIDDGLAWVKRYTHEAAQGGAEIVCFPESYIPGMRGIDEPVGPHDPTALAAAAASARQLARECGLAMILPMDWDHPQGIENTALVISKAGELLGRQAKTQLDPAEDGIFVPGMERRLFEVDDLKFGIAICHEAFRYPESVRWAAVRGATVVFHPHCTGSNHEGRRLTEWRGRENRYFEHAMVCRALENDIYFASVNYTFKFQESATCVVSPDGEGIAQLPYGEAGVLFADLDLTRASRRLALRFRPERYP
jgi:5-aminopentanamidase